MGMDIGRQVVSVVGVEKGRQILYLGQRTTVFRILQASDLRTAEYNIAHCSGLYSEVGKRLGAKDES